MNDLLCLKGQELHKLWNPPFFLLHTVSYCRWIYPRKRNKLSGVGTSIAPEVLDQEWSLKKVFRVNSVQVAYDQLCESTALQIWTNNAEEDGESYLHCSQWLCKVHFSKKTEKAIGQHSRFLSVPKRKNTMTNNYQWHSIGDRKSNMAQKTSLWRTQPQS